MRNFTWAPDWRASAILESMMTALKEDPGTTKDQIGAVATMIGQVHALEATTSLSLPKKNRIIRKKKEAA